MRQGAERGRRTLAGLMACGVLCATQAGAVAEAAPAPGLPAHPGETDHDAPPDPAAAALAESGPGRGDGAADAGRTVFRFACSLSAPDSGSGDDGPGAGRPSRPLILAQNSSAAGTVDAPAAGAAAEAPAPAQEAGLWNFGWALAPVRWGGTLVTQVSMQNTSNSARVLQRTESANFVAGSYVWQPWFAQVRGNLGLLTSDAQTETGGRDVRADSTGIFGGAQLLLFPVSRFPFTATFDVSDSRASDEAISTQFTHTRLGLQQRYTPPAGATDYEARYDRSILDSTQGQHDTLDVFTGRMSTRFGRQGLSLTGQHTRNRGTGGNTLTSNLSAQHAFQAESALSVSTLASASLAESPALAGVSETRALQLNTFGTWRPATDSPLNLTGGARAFQFTSGGGGRADSETTTLGANVGASYRVSRNVNTFGSASLTHTSQNNADNLITSQSAGASYNSDPIPLGKFNYTWNASGSAANRTSGTAEGGGQTVGGGLGHSVNRSVSLAANSSLNLFASQSVSTALDTRNAQSHSLSSTAGGAWSLAPSAQTQTFLSLTASDVRASTGTTDTEFQLINLQANGRVQFSRYAFGGANMTVQAVRQGAASGSDDGFVTSSSGSLTYYHLQAFGVPRLRYSALYNAYLAEYQSRAAGDINAPLEQVSQSLEQRLEYNIGRLDFRLTLRVADIAGERNTLIFFRVARQLGNF